MVAGAMFFGVSHSVLDDGEVREHDRVSVSAAEQVDLASSQPRTLRRTDTWVIGDSITVRGNLPWLNRIEPSWNVDGVGGRLVDELPSRINFMIRRLGFPRNIVIALGSNPSEGWSKADYQRIVDRIPDNRNVFFVTAYRGEIWGGSEMVTKYSRWMKRIARAEPNVHIIDWRRRVLRGEVELSDDLHASRGEGERFWAGLVSNRVDQVNRRLSSR